MRTEENRQLSSAATTNQHAKSRISNCEFFTKKGPIVKAADIKAVTGKVTKKWAKQRKREERSARARFNRRESLYSTRVNQTDVARRVIPEAYAKASDNGRLPAHARQIYYAARKEIEDYTGRRLSSVYFTQTLLPQFLNNHPGRTGNWWVVYDARGHIIEPHTDEEIPLGTLAVDTYLRDIANHEVDDPQFDEAFKTRYPTCGPRNRFSAILFIEKEGFNPLFEKVQLAERYDLAIMSTKGQSVVAARRLVDELCHGDVPVLVLHDFDREGFLISERLTSVSWAAEEAGRVRYAFRNEINVLDLGLRLQDIHDWNLESEQVRFKGGFDDDSITTPEEQQFLSGNQRVELNAFTSADLITWIESKLAECGIQKVVPDDATLRDAYQRAYHIQVLNQTMREIDESARQEAEKVKVPESLASDIRSELEQNPARSWDGVVAELSQQDLKDREQDAEGDRPETE